MRFSLHFPTPSLQKRSKRSSPWKLFSFAPMSCGSGTRHPVRKPDSNWLEFTRQLQRPGMTVSCCDIHVGFIASYHTFFLYCVFDSQKCIVTRATMDGWSTCRGGGPRGVWCKDKQPGWPGRRASLGVVISAHLKRIHGALLAGNIYWVIQLRENIRQYPFWHTDNGY